MSVGLLGDYDFPRFSDRGLCAEVGGELFYPEGQGSSPREAKAICRRCPVVQECLAWALDHEEKWGVWGATSENERRRLRSRQLQRRALAQRDLEIQSMAGQGWSSAAVARSLGCTVRTVQRVLREAS